MAAPLPPLRPGLDDFILQHTVKGMTAFAITLAGMVFSTVLQAAGSIVTSLVVGSITSYLLEKEIPDGGRYQSVIKVAKYVLPLLAALCVNYALLGVEAITMTLITIVQITAVYQRREPTSAFYRNYQHI